MPGGRGPIPADDRPVGGPAPSVSALAGLGLCFGKRVRTGFALAGGTETRRARGMAHAGIGFAVCWAIMTLVLDGVMEVRCLRFRPIIWETIQILGVAGKE